MLQMLSQINSLSDQGSELHDIAQLLFTLNNGNVWQHMKDQLIYAPWLLTRFCLLKSTEFRNATDIF
ncbi:hypothetical protein T01_6926 [Trichinella spiralis]|uniref:HTH merR-type domain-containing protein n=1 Tax=Trichinella spiralis TaxID=6334 RepID=A0A0V1BNG4_TRISP|nr:hypothetical protein T01_6926 [Trichinella spiralis]